MKNTTPSGVPASRLARLLDALDYRIFQRPDAEAIARGWQVRRSRPFTRVYRDPRWDQISACTDCSGSGLDGAATCSGCGGAGTVRAVSEPAEGTLR